mgnify:CR=1 FL=1
MFDRLKRLWRVPTADFAAKPEKPVMDELAPVTMGRDITHGIVDGLPLLPDQDDLASRDGGLRLDTYVKVHDDFQVMSALQQRRNAVVANEWEVIPGGPRRADKKAADLIDRLLNALPWDDITSKMHYGVFHGHAASECLWMRDGTQIVPEAIRVRDARRFAYRPDGALVLLTATNPLGETLPARKFWAYQTGATHHDDPYGMGLAHWCYWPVQFKRGVAKLWLIALDKYASPTALGYFPPNASEAERARLLAALAAIRNQAALALPEGMKAELLAASRSGAADYQAAASYWDQAISKVILGHSAATDSTPGRLGGEDGAAQAREDLVTADADVLCASANLTWVRWVTEWSVPGAAVPMIWRRTEGDEDLNARAERDRRIFDLGYRPTLAQIVATYGGDWEVVGDPSAGDGSAADGTNGADGETPASATDLAAPLAPADPPDPIASQIARLEREAAPEIEAMLARVRRELDEATDLAAFQGRLLTLYPELQRADLTELLAMAFAAVDLAGRDSVQEEADGDSV